eukprot:c28700_g1_i1 orf=614-2155(-)
MPGGIFVDLMANQPAAIPTASVVGNAFVNQYYNVLHQSPSVVHRFYTDASRLSRAEAGPNGIVDTVAGQAEIHEKVLSLDYGDIRAEIKTVDSQESLDGSVLVMVTGALFSQSRMKRNFVQTFFLAPQEKGYFVLNDMFRYLDDDLQSIQSVTQIQSMSNGLPDSVRPAQTPAADDQGVEPDPSEHESRDYDQPASEEDISPDVHYDQPDQVEVSEIKEVVGEVPLAPQDVPTPVPAAEEVTGELPKKSYASILRVPKDMSAASVVATQSVQVKVTHVHADRFISQSAPAAPAVESTAGAGSTADNLDETPQVVDGEGDGCSVYVKNLPHQITLSELEVEFGKFGQIKPGGTNLRNQKLGVCFAFIEFEEPGSAQTAIEHSPISIGGRQVYVEEKRPMVPRAGRGRFPQGRGYQNEGGRGRGYFSGRGSGRGGQDFDRDFNRGRGSGMGRSGYVGGSSYTSSSSSTFNYYNSNGYRRPDGQGGNGPRPARRGAGNQVGRGGPIARGGATVTAA